MKDFQFWTENFYNIAPNWELMCKKQFTFYRVDITENFYDCLKISTSLSFSSTKS